MKTLQGFSQYCSERITLGRILALATALRIIAILVLRKFRAPVTWEFGTIANAINSGFGYSYNTVLPDGRHAPTAFIPPGYPYILAGFLRIFGDHASTYLLIEIINALLGAALVYVVYRLAALLFSEKAALLSALIVAVYPAQVFMCTEFHSISFYIVLGVMAIWFLTHYLQISHSWKDVAYAGVCMGLLLLFRSEALGLLFLYAVVIVIRGKTGSILHAALFMLLALLCLSPWLYRNYRVFDKHFVLSTSGAPNFWIGNNEHATGSQHYAYTDALTPEQRKALDSVPLNNEVELGQDKLFTQYAKDFIRAHPKDEVRLAFKKLFIFFVFDKTHEEGRRPLYWIPSILLTIAAAWGAYLRRKHLLREDLLLVVTILFTVFISMVFFVLPRYKIAIDPFFMMFAAYAAAWIWSRIDPQNASGSSLKGSK